MSEEKGYRGTARTLEVLRALNKEDGQSVVQLSVKTGISRAALYRILAEFQRAGYVSRAAKDGSIHLTSLVQTLSAGYQDETRIREVAGPILDGLQQSVVWPTDLGVLHNYKIRLVVTTRSHSPMVVDRGFAGIEMPIVFTSLGQAYLAYCAPNERKAIIEYIVASPKSVDSEFLQNRAQTNRLLQTIKSQGYGSRYRRSYDETRYPGIINDTSSIAVPVMRGKFAIASLGITFISSALTIQQAANRHLKDMQIAAARIGKELEQWDTNIKK